MLYDMFNSSIKSNYVKQSETNVYFNIYFLFFQGKDQYTELNNV